MEECYYVLPHEREDWSAVRLDLVSEKHWNMKRLRDRQNAESFLDASSSVDASLFVEKHCAKLAVIASKCGEIFGEKRIPLLVSGFQGQIRLSQTQVLCLLCCGFFGVLANQKTRNLPPVCSFKRIFPSGSLWPFYSVYFEKALCLYEKKELDSNEIVIERHVLKEEVKFEKSLCSLDVNFPSRKGIETSDAEGHVNFAHEKLGGLLFGGAVAQEEILMAFRSELTVATLFCETMKSTECITVQGCKRWSKPEGYGRGVECTEWTEEEKKIPCILCMDAQYGCLGNNLFFFSFFSLF